MKKRLVPFLAAAALVTCTSTGFAGDFTSDAGAMLTLTVAGVTTTSTNLTYTPSPGVGLAVSTSATNFSMTSANSLTDNVNGMEYGTLSTSEGYAQRTKTTTVNNGPAATTSATALPGASWGWVGGS